MAERDPLQHFIGRATRDGEFPKTKKNGDVIQTRDGKRFGSVRVAIQYGYGDDADKEFINVETANERLAPEIPEINKGEVIGVVGVRRSNGEYEDSIMAFEIYKMDKLGVKKSEDDDGDF